MGLEQYPVYSVSQINGYVKDLIDRDGLLSGLLVRGEISNYKRYPSGHHYFSLKDAQSTLRCVLFRGDAARLRFQPANGMSVLAFGRVSVFPRDGQYQFYCTQMLPDGQGALDQAFEQLRSRLEQEGLFDTAAKRKLPDFPRRIALVTSPAGAAVRDMLRILDARWPLAEVLVVPVRVQGEGAAEEIAAAIHDVNNRPDIDLIITGRGGGSREDLWAFNEECVARAISVSNIPVISAVGHEPDVSISDYVADLRAATPSNAAELAVPDQKEIRTRLKHLCGRMLAAQRGHIMQARRSLERLRESRALCSMYAPIQDRRMLLDSAQRRMAAALSGQLKAYRAELVRLSAALDAMSPLKVLGRGYAITRKSGGVVTSVAQLEAGDRLDVMVSDGVLYCTVEDKERQVWQ